MVFELLKTSVLIDSSQISSHHGLPMHLFLFSLQCASSVGLSSSLTKSQGFPPLLHCSRTELQGQKFTEFLLLLGFLLWFFWKITVSCTSRSTFRKYSDSIINPRGSSTRTSPLSTLEMSLKHLFPSGHCPNQTRNTANNIF